MTTVECMLIVLCELLLYEGLNTVALTDSTAVSTQLREVLHCCCTIMKWITEYQCYLFSEQPATGQ